MKFIKRILFLIICCSLLNISAQSNYKINFESGYLYSDTKNLSDNNEILSKIDFKYSYSKSGLTGNLKIQPGFLGVDFSPKSLKIKGEINYLRSIKNNPFSISTSYQLNKYYEEDTFNLGIFSISLFGRVRVSDGFSVSSQFSFNRQSTKFFASQIINRFNFSSSASISLSRYFFINGGLFGEKYFIKSESNTEYGHRSENQGFRAGPVFSINFTKDFIFRGSYRFLYQEAEIFDNAFYEHKFRLLIGKLLNENWSLFILVDYTQPVYDFQLTSYNDKNLLYISSNYENNYYLKLSRKLNENISLYSKTGYFNESIKYLGYDFKGWNWLVGIEIK